MQQKVNFYQLETVIVAEKQKANILIRLMCYPLSNIVLNCNFKSNFNQRAYYEGGLVVCTKVHAYTYEYMRMYKFVYKISYVFHWCILGKYVHNSCVHMQIYMFVITPSTCY